PITPVVKKLLIINGAIFLFQQFAGLLSPNTIERIFGLHHIGLIYEFKLWQVFTYMFLHGGWMHIIFNLFALWMFAGDLENQFGSKAFLKFYLYSGIGAGIFIAVMNYISYTKYGISSPTIGASGALYAILLAYGMTWPNREVLLYFVIPVKIKYLVLGFGLIEFFGILSTLSGQGSNISHIGHIGGLISGFIIIMIRRKSTPGQNSSTRKGDGNVINLALKKARIKKKRKDIETRIKAKKIIDELLEKIARNGMSSLSPEEKKLLEWARNNYYPENNDIVH
ncbi:rhomboid family intramembrane serine protease, partial [Spirochaetota bacterium]